LQTQSDHVLSAAPVSGRIRPWHWWAAAVAVLAAAGALYAMGRLAWCACGYVKLWHGIVMSSENSQHIADWYSFTHLIHGFLFYLVLWLLAPRWSLGSRLVMAVALESAWEVFENTDFIINRYRETTISLDYFGDSIVNSVADILLMLLGFVAAAYLPVSMILILAITMELWVGYMIRDNLLLNILMLIHPSDIWTNSWERLINFIRGWF
jgi:hypothetical protein